jgi:hypothetical protein
MRRPTRQDANADVQERVLAVHLRNHATYTEWFDETVRVTPPKTDRRTGELKPGISESTFRGLRRALLERGRVTRLTTGQGSIYSVVTTVGATSDMRPTNDADSVTVANLDETVAMTGCWGAPQSTAETSPSGEDLIARAMCHARLRKWPGEA